MKISPQFLLTAGEGKQEQSANKVTSRRLSEGKSMDEKMDLISGRITALFPSPFFNINVPSGTQILGIQLPLLVILNNMSLLHLIRAVLL